MKQVDNIATIFPKELFWDVNPSQLNVQEDKDFIIPRALYATTESTFTNDISRLERLYKRIEIIKELKSTKERISNKVCTMVAQRYHIKHFSRY
jgi:predicted molibdopterin-dependent oxidoreductase YjgC